MSWLLLHWRLVVVALGLLSAYYAGYQTKDMLCDAATARAEKALIEKAVEEQERANAVAGETEKKLEALRVANRRLNAKLTHELKNPAYNCPVPAGGVRAINDAVSPSPSDPDN